MGKLNSAAVEKVFMDCLFNEGEDTTNHVVSDGIVTKVGFNPRRLEAHREEVLEMLIELPDEFKQSGGGGWSFLNACMTKDGRQWGEHSNMEQLFQLGNALGLSAWQMPRDMWNILPGGMPYVVVKDKQLKAA